MTRIEDTLGGTIDYVVDGSGGAVLVLHGAYSTRAEVVPVFGPLLAERGLRGVYPDLPGMGASQTSVARSSDDVLDALDAVIAADVGAEPLVVIGHSFGAFLARGVAARHPEQVVGLALISPFVDDFEPAPARVAEDDGTDADIDPALREEYRGYFSVRTEATRERFERIVRPALGQYDGEAVDRIMTASALDPDPDAAPFGGPVAILVGRDDSLVGWRAQRRLGDIHPRATLVVAADAGHALLHERPHLVHAVLADLLDRVESDGGAGRGSATLST